MEEEETGQTEWEASHYEDTGKRAWGPAKKYTLIYAIIPVQKEEQ